MIEASPITERIWMAKGLQTNMLRHETAVKIMHLIDDDE